MIENPLSHGQRALWFVHQMDPSSTAYNVYLALRIISPLDIEALRRSFQAVVDRHAPLRSTFAERDGVPFQRIAPGAEVDFAVHDVQHLSPAAVRERLVREVHRPFDLEQGPVFRVALFRTDGAHELVVTTHHIATDMWSTIVILEEIAALYPAARRGAAAALPPLVFEYADYVRWQLDTLGGPEGERRWDYWREALRGELPVLDLPTDRPRPPVQAYRGRLQRFAVDGQLLLRLRELAREERASVFAFLVAAFQTLLYRLSGQPEVLIGAPTAGRTRPELDGVVGHFVNPVVLRVDLRPGWCARPRRRVPLRRLRGSAPRFRPRRASPDSAAEADSGRPARRL